MRKFLLASVATLGTPGDWRARLWRRARREHRCRHLYRHQHRYQGRSAHRTRGSRRGRQLRRRPPMSTPTTTTRPDAAGRARQPDAGNHRRPHQRQGGGGRRRGYGPALINARYRAERLAGSRADHQHRQRDHWPPALPRPPARHRVPSWALTAPAQRSCSRKLSPASPACISAVTAWRPMGCAMARRSKSARTSAERPAAPALSASTLLIAGDLVCAACLHLRCWRQLGHRARRPG